MEFLIATSLPFDVVAYHGLIPMFSNCAREIPIGPKLPSPQLLLDLRTQSEHFSRGYTFDHRYQLRHTIHRHRLHQKMNMIPIYPDFQKLYLIALLYLQANVSNHLIHSPVKYRSSIFRREHHVIQQNAYIVTLMLVLAHASTLRPKGRGINPAKACAVTRLYIYFAR